MARGALGWSARELATGASVGINTITRFENGSDTLASTITKLRIALEAGGVEFIPENGGGPGVRLRKEQKPLEPIRVEVRRSRRRRDE
jgi:transcriptional regulator with XRE-family HTH domain